MNKSIWQEISLPQFPTLEGDCKTDVCIIGGGLTGLLCAHELQKRGIEYTLIEADRVIRGTSGRTTAKITSQHGLIYGKLLKTIGEERAKLYWQSNEIALCAMRELCTSVDCDFQEQNNYIYSRDTLAPLEAEMKALEMLGIPAQLDLDLPLPFTTAGAVCFSNQGQFHPGKLATCLAKGKRICENTAALNIHKNVVITNRGNIQAEKIIVATHFPFIDRYGAYFAKMYQKRSYVLALTGAGKLEGMYLDCQENGLSLRMQGDLLLLGGGGHRTGKRGGGWEALEAAAKVWYPESREVYRWAAQDCITLDGIPYIGQYSPLLPDVYVATGFNKWGMTSAMLSAQSLADMVQGRRNDYQSLFDPSRSMNMKLFANLGHSALHLLKPTAPRCSHLGCALEWNRQERAWECPCHGSRFSECGEVLENPAQKNKNFRRTHE